MKIPRGIFNRNPGNLRKSATVWQGQADVQADPDFITFKAPLWGLRALAKVLLSYERKYDIGTASAVVEQFAPKSENDTDAYVADIASRMGVQPDAEIDLTDPETLGKLVAAIVHHECGEQPYDSDLIATAVALALTPPPKEA